jgi:integrase/recombinase XerD
MKVAEAVKLYVERKRSGGLLYDKAMSNFSGFSRHVGDVSLSGVTTHGILTFLDGPHTSTVTWRDKYNLLKHFFEFWSARGAMPMLLMPQPRPVSRQTFVPYIYTRTEIRNLLGKVEPNQNQGPCTIGAHTFRTLLLLLYGTGALVGEVLNLLREDVNLKGGFITFRSRRFNRSRCVPIGPDLRNILRTYLDAKGLRDSPTAEFFVTKNGQPLIARTLNWGFHKLRERSGIVRRDGASYQPRMHDLRSTFAVHRITSWIRNGADMNRMLPALSAYMGLKGLASTERYFTLTPERFRKQLVVLSPRSRQKRWRDNPVLLRFLESL